MPNNIFARLLGRSCTRSAVKVENKKRALQFLSELFAGCLDEVSLQKILEQLTARERLGSTEIGQGVALPHARIEAHEQPALALMTLATPISYETKSNNQVDILCGLLVPSATVEQHLDILKDMANLFQQAKFCQALRHADDDTSLYTIATSWQNED